MIVHYAFVNGGQITGVLCGTKNITGQAAFCDVNHPLLEQSFENMADKAFQVKPPEGLSPCGDCEVLYSRKEENNGEIQVKEGNSN